MTSKLTAGNIPVISITADCLPDAWEKCMLAVWENGVDIKTQYDKPEDLPSKDATVIVTVTNPFAEPRIHKNFPGGPAELEVYCQEVVAGIHDHWIDPSAGKWAYTYHERLNAYSPVENITIDQIQYIIDSLSQTCHTRRAQAITWMPTIDTTIDDPPCLQRIFCRLVSTDTGELALNMNTHWRSRDLYKAWFMNVYAFTELQRIMAEQISQKINKIVTPGRYVDISDSLHIYGSYFDQVACEIEKMRKEPFTQRAWDSTHPAFEMMTGEAREKLAKDPDCYAKG